MDTTTTHAPGWPPTTFTIRCTHCGAPSGTHKGGTDKAGPAARCPADKVFPSWPRGMDEDKAGPVFDRKLAAYWGARSTTFKAAA